MAYNNGFPVSYPQYYMPQYQPQVPQIPQVQSQAPQQQPQMNSNLIWVQGEAGAKSYLVAPNTTVQLWDSERQTIYIKSADMRLTRFPVIRLLVEIREQLLLIAVASSRKQLQDGHKLKYGPLLMS